MAAVFETKSPSLPTTSGMPAAVAVAATRVRGPTLDEALCTPFEFSQAQQDQLARVHSLINIVNTTMDQTELLKASSEADAILLSLRRVLDDKVPNSADLLRELKLRERKAGDDKRRADATKAATTRTASTPSVAPKAQPKIAATSRSDSKGETKSSSGSSAPSTVVDNVNDVFTHGVGIAQTVDVLADVNKVYSAICNINDWWSATKWHDGGNAATVGSTCEVDFDLDRVTLRVVQAKVNEYVVWEIDSSSFMFLGTSEWTGTKLVFRITPLTEPTVFVAPADTPTDTIAADATATTAASAATTAAATVASSSSTDDAAPIPRCRIHMMHVGLHRDYHQCHHYTSIGWNHYIGTSLKELIITGTGKPFVPPAA